MPSVAHVLPPLWAVLGMTVGSFLNAAADRIPARRSLLRPPSHCETCGRRLRSHELVPVLSYLAQRGRCRSCGAPIGVRTLAVELATGILFGLAAAVFTPVVAADWLTLLFTSFYLAIFVLVTVTDLEQGLIPNRVILPATGVALVDTVLTGWPGGLDRLIGGILGAGVIALIILLVPSGMGWGDAKLAGCIGLIAGLPGLPIALFIGFVSGGIVAAVLLASGRSKRGDRIALGPFLALGGTAALLFEEGLLAAFRTLAGQ